MPDLSLLDDILFENSSLLELQRELDSQGYSLIDLEARDVTIKYRIVNEAGEVVAYSSEALGTIPIIFCERRVRDLGVLRKRREQAVVYKDEKEGKYVLRRYELVM